MYAKDYSKKGGSMDLEEYEWLEDRIDVFIESNIKENRLRSKINYGKKILRKRSDNDISNDMVHLIKYKAK